MHLAISSIEESTTQQDSLSIRVEHIRIYTYGTSETKGRPHCIYLYNLGVAQPILTDQRTSYGNYVLAYVPMYINGRDCDKVFRMSKNKVLQDV